jgi:hypothetical protein
MAYNILSDATFIFLEVKSFGFFFFFFWLGFLYMYGQLSIFPTEFVCVLLGTELRGSHMLTSILPLSYTPCLQQRFHLLSLSSKGLELVAAEQWSSGFSLRGTHRAYESQPTPMSGF